MKISWTFGLIFLMSVLNHPAWAEKEIPSAVKSCKIQTYGLHFLQTPVSRNDCVERLRKARSFQFGVDREGNAIRVIDIAASGIIGGGLFALEQSRVSGRLKLEVERVYRESLEDALRLRLDHQHDFKAQEALNEQAKLRPEVGAKLDVQIAESERKMKEVEERQRSYQNLKSAGNKEIYVVGIRKPNIPYTDQVVYSHDELTKAIQVLKSKPNLSEADSSLLKSLEEGLKAGVYNKNGEEIFAGKVFVAGRKPGLAGYRQVVLTAAERQEKIEDGKTWITAENEDQMWLRSVRATARLANEENAAKTKTLDDLAKSRLETARLDYEKTVAHFKLAEADNMARWMKIGRATGVSAMIGAAGVALTYIKMRAERKTDDMLTESSILGSGAAVETVCRNGFDGHNPDHDQIAAAINEAVQTIENCAAFHAEAAKLLDSSGKTASPGAVRSSRSR